MKHSNRIKMIFGAPGTGKTTRLLEIFEELLQKYSAKDIACVSYTRAGANQFKSRAKKLFKLTVEDCKYIATLHSIGYRSLNLGCDSLMDKTHYKNFSDKMGMNFSGYYTEDLRNDNDKYLFFDELYRNNQKLAMQYIDDFDLSMLKFVRHNYKRYKDLHRVIDFTDIIQMFVEKNEALPVKIAIIDEAQDLTTLQWLMIWVAFRNCEKIYIAGDDDQAIYEWQGADVRYFLGITGEVEILDKSYRLPKQILDFSNRIAQKIGVRVAKNFASTEKEGLVDIIETLDEIKFNKDESYMILSRNNYFLNKIEIMLREKSLLYTRKNKLSFSKKEYNLIKLYEKCRQKGEITEKEQERLNFFLTPNFKLSDVWYNSFRWTEERKIYFRDIIAAKKDMSICNIAINTIHAVKGEEADNVILLSDITKNVFKNFVSNEDSEHRVFYVGCTRAKKNLYILNTSSKYSYQFF